MFLSIELTSNPNHFLILLHTLHIHPRFASLDLGLLATSFCLLRLPKMPELKDVLQRNSKNGRQQGLPHFVPAGPEIDIYAIPFKDKAREKARQKRLAEEFAKGGKNAKLIKAEQRQAERERKVAQRRQQQIDKGRNPDKKRGKRAQLVDEWDDLAKEERLHKKLRRHKITQAQFDEEMHSTHEDTAAATGKATGKSAN